MTRLPWIIITVIIIIIIMLLVFEWKSTTDKGRNEKGNEEWEEIESENGSKIGRMKGDWIIRQTGENQKCEMQWKERKTTK